MATRVEILLAKVAAPGSVMAFVVLRRTADSSGTPLFLRAWSTQFRVRARTFLRS
jgi:hypothetical protein